MLGRSVFPKVWREGAVPRAVLSLAEVLVEGDGGLA